MGTNTKQCTKCKVEKPAANFSRAKGSSDGLQSYCRECKREAFRKYRAENPEKVREGFRKWAAANPERRREYNRAWKKANPEKVRERGREYRAANPEKHRALCAKRRALKREALAPTASQDAITALHAEAKMAEAFTGQPFAVDHVTPLARGGKHHEDNLRVIPARLNNVKHAKLDSEVDSAEFHAWVYGPPTFQQVTYRSFHKGNLKHHAQTI